MLRFVIVFFCLTFPLSASAETLLLLQGYLEDGDYWRKTGITRILGEAGWNDAGHLRLGPQGIRSTRPPSGSGPRFYTVSLPTEAPLLAQHGYLEQYLTYIRHQNPHDSLVLAGHSAGGILGRLYMVQHPEAGVDTLITIASPHLGTDTAEIGLAVGQSPLAWIAPLLGAEVFNRSQGLYRDLVREQPGSLLFWLNRQEHPKARYVSIVRKEDGTLGMGDLVVPAWSQDMNNVYALRGRARSITVDGNHGLTASDGTLLVRILERLSST
jgi:pimeloyl-ACP methyl ester carboxylesterase